MRANGVPDFPDPSSSAGGGFQFKDQINPQSPSVHAAIQACRKYMPAKPNPGAMSPSQRAHAVVFARCMRSRGISNFPDPIVGRPSPTVNERVLALRGMFFVVGPGLDPLSPAFRQAASACGVKPPPLGHNQVRIG